MTRKYLKDDLIWKKQFGNFLKKIFKEYKLDYVRFAETYSWSPSTVRYWFLGRSLPQQKALLDLIKFLEDKIESSRERDMKIYDDANAFFTERREEKIYLKLRGDYPKINQFAGEVLSVCYDFAKHKNAAVLSSCEYQSTGRTQVVVFDFDGTLTVGKTNRTTWESLWTSLGYDVKMCQNLHMKYDRGEISHVEWCKITEEKFKERFLHRNAVEEIASKIKFMKGTRDTLRELQKRDIKIYIVSGSILTIICSALGNMRQYIDGIKANQFRFNDSSGFLTDIIGTRYDFEGKADYINKIAQELNISARDILFIGNSLNDRFAYESGARTLCINPRLTDATNRVVWNDCIQTCDNLTEILEYL